MARKMILVDPKVMEALQQQQQQQQPLVPQSLPPPPLDSTKAKLASLDDDMRAILENKELSAYKKSVLYHQTLRRYMDFHDQYKHRPIGTVRVASESTERPVASKAGAVDQLKDELEGDVEKEVLKTVPVSLKTKALSLLLRLKRDPKVVWNEKGELIYDGKVQRNSNMTDLINDVLRRRKQPPPRGWETFARVLKENNVPRDLIGNPQRWTYLNTTSSGSSGSTRDSSDNDEEAAAAAAMKRPWIDY